MAHHEPRLTAATVESPLPSNRHGGFGERSGETGRWQHRNRAPDRLNKRMRRMPARSHRVFMLWVMCWGSSGVPTDEVKT